MRHRSGRADVGRRRGAVAAEPQHGRDRVEGVPWPGGQAGAENGVLTISGERREETKEKNRQEFHYGSFRRTLTLPAGAQSDQVTAAYTDGVLEVRVPLSSEAPPTTRIPIQRHE